MSWSTWTSRRSGASPTAAAGALTAARWAPPRARKRARIGFDYVHSLVDDHSRLAYSEIHPDEQGPTCAAFLTRAAAYFADHGITPIERVMTDNHWSYTRTKAVAAVINEPQGSPQAHQAALPVALELRGGVPDGDHRGRCRRHVGGDPGPRPAPGGRGGRARTEPVHELLGVRDPVPRRWSGVRWRRGPGRPLAGRASAPGHRRAHPPRGDGDRHRRGRGRVRRRARRRAPGGSATTSCSSRPAGSRSDRICPASTCRWSTACSRSTTPRRCWRWPRRGAGGSSSSAAGTSASRWPRRTSSGAARQR